MEETKSSNWTASYTLTEEEIRKAVDITLPDKNSAKHIGQLVILGFLVVLFGVGCVLSAAGVLKGHVELGGTLCLLGISLFAFLAVLFEPMLLSKSTVKEALQERKETVMKGAKNGISFKAQDETKYLSWDEFVIGEYDDLYMIRLGTGYVLPVPKRALDETGTEALSSHCTEQTVFEKVLKGKKK